MARRTQVLLEDDLDGGEATETLRFAFDGKSYAIDLNAKNAAKFRKAISPYVEAARRDSTSGRTPTARFSSDVDPKAVRAWASANGYQVSVRGRVGADLVAAFKAAGN
jgi:Lsr2